MDEIISSIKFIVDDTKSNLAGLRFPFICSPCEAVHIDKYPYDSCDAGQCLRFQKALKLSELFGEGEIQPIGGRND